jgi:hypothetical protein
MWTYQLSHLSKIALALVCICLCVFASACQGNGRSPVYRMQRTPLAKDTNQRETRNQGLVVQQQQRATPTPTIHTTLNSGSPFYFAMG